MTTEAQVRAAKGPPEALLAIAQALDRIEAIISAPPVEPDPWGTWKAANADNWGVRDTDGQTFSTAFTVEETDEGTIIDIKPVSEERQAQRRETAVSTLQLEDNFPNIGAVEAYVIGGPVWLYDFDRDFMLQLPAGTRQHMIADLMQDDPIAALEMGRDLLMDRGSGAAPATGGEWV